MYVKLKLSRVDVQSWKLSKHKSERKSMGEVLWIEVLRDWGYADLEATDISGELTGPARGGALSVLAYLVDSTPWGLLRLSG